MKIKVNPHNIEIVREQTEPINELEVNVSKCEFEFDEKITNEFVKEAYFTLNGSTYKQIIVNNECDYPSEVLTETGTLEIGVVAYKVENGEELIRYNPSPDYYDTWVGSLKDAENTEPLTPTDKEQMQSQISQNTSDISDLQANKQDKLTQGDNITIDENNVISAVDTIYDDTEIKADIQELQETKIDKDVNNLTYYTLTTETGSKIKLSIDSSTYVMTLKLKDKNNNDISTANVDLPLETMVVGARYDSATKEIVLTLKNGQEVRFSVADLVSGLQTEITENNKLSSDLVDDTNNTNKFVSAEEKAQITTNKNDIIAIKDGEEIDSFADVENAFDDVDTALGLKEDKSNKVTEINSSSTDTQYPSAKCVYYSQEEQNEHIAELEMLYNAFPTVSDEDTTIQLDNTAKVKFRGIDLKGNTSQVVIPEEQGTSVSNTSIYVSDVDTDKENTIEMSGNTYQETTSISGGDEYDSPSPEHPQNIEVVTGTNTIKIVGKNLFDISKVERNVYYNYGTTGSVPTIATSDKRITLSPTNSIKVKPSTQYTLSFPSAFRYAMAEMENNYISLGDSGWKTNTTYTFTTSATTNYIGFNFSKTDNSTITDNDWNTFINSGIQIEEGSTATTYEPYVSQTYPINLGNIELCKIDTYQDRIYKSNDKWYLEKNIDKVVLDGTQDIYKVTTGTTGYYRYNVDIGENIYTTDRASTVAPFYCNKLLGVTRENTYARVEGIAPTNTSYSYKSFNIYIEAISQMTAEQVNTWFSNNNTIVYYPYATPTTTEITDSTLVSQLNALYNATIYPITNINTETSNLLPYIDLHYNFVTPSPSPNRPSVVNVVKGNNTITISNSDNTESQNYPINLGDMELCKIDTYQDRIYKSNDKWYLEKNIQRVVLNGSSSETWGFSTAGGYYRSTLNSIVDGYTYNDTARHIGMFISSHFKSNTSNGIGNCFQYQNTYLFYPLLDITTIAQWITWLNNNNMTLYYVLATPTTTEITDTTLITQLNNIKKAYSYDTQTNISQTNTDKPFIIYAEAIRSLKDVFE